MFTCAIATAYLLLGTSYTSSYAGWSYMVQGGRIIVRRVDAREPSSGLRAGDEIIEFSGRTVTSDGRPLRNFLRLLRLVPLTTSCSFVMDASNA